MRYVRRAWALVSLPILSIFLAVVVGSLVILVAELLVGGNLRLELPLRAYAALLSGSVGSPNALINSLVQATPLLLGGLSVGFAFKAGLFNIGAQGQFLIGALTTVAVGVQFRTFEPGFVGMLVAITAGTLAGAAYGAIPGILKAVSGAHEVVTTIMLNFVAVSTVAALVSTVFNVPGSPSPITFSVGNAELPVIIGRNGHLGILIAPLIAIGYGFLLFRTTWGFEIRTVGANPEAARYAGMSPRLVVVVAMAVAGGLAGLAGATELLGVTHHMTASYGTTVGFDSIAVALLGRTNPLGIMLAALLFGGMRAGAGAMQIQAGVPAELVGVLQATILFFIVASVLVRRVFRLRVAGPGLDEATTITRTYGGEAPRTA
ncbi:MAG: ABC transporter permease [Chloroflexota bacterium]|nr:ABC transporter permease [Chloroflexota bacterium]